MPVVEYKGSNESGSFEYKFPFRNNNNKWQRNSSSPQQSLTASPQSGTPNRAVSLGASMGKTLSAERPERAAAIPRSVSSDGRPLDSKRCVRWLPVCSGAFVKLHFPFIFLSLVFICICVYRSFSTSLRMSPGSENYALTSSLMLGRSPHNRSSPSNLSCSSDTGSGSPAHWRQKSMPEGWGSTKHLLLLSTSSLSLVSFKLLTVHPLITQSSHRFICSSFHTALFMTRWLWHRPQNDASDWQHMRVYVSVIDLLTTGTLLSQRSGNWGQRMEAAASRHPAGPEWRTALTDRHQVRPHSISDELLKGRGINVRCLEVKRGKDQWRWLLEKMNELNKTVNRMKDWKGEWT